MENAERVLITQARRWSFTDKDSDKQVRGARITYITGDKIIGDDGSTGTSTLEATIDTPLYDLLQGSLPAVCDVRTRLQQRGKNTTVVCDEARIVAPIDLRQLVKQAPKAA